MEYFYNNDVFSYKKIIEKNKGFPLFKTNKTNHFIKILKMIKKQVHWHFFFALKKSLFKNP